MNSLNPSLQHPPDTRILPAVWKLLRLRLRTAWNSFRHAKLRNKIGQITFAALIVAFAYFIMFLSRLLLSVVRSPEFSRYVGVDLRALIASIPALTLTSLFVTVLLTSFGVLLQVLYLAGDMDFLLTAPIPIRAVFVANLLQAALSNFALMALFGLPLLYGLGLSNNYNISYYIVVIAVMIVLALSAAGLASLLVMLVARVLPPRRTAEILGFIGATLGLGCSQLGNLAVSFGRQFDVSGTRLTGMLLLANTHWLPLNWAGQGVVALGEGRWLNGILLVGGVLIFAGAIFGFALITAEKWYYSGWARMQVISSKKAVKRPTHTHADRVRWRLARLLPSPVAAILQKDFMTLRRDLRSLSQLISPMILGALYTVMLLRGAGVSEEINQDPDLITTSFQTVLAYGSVGMSLFVGWMILSHLATMSFSHEGKNYWMLKAAPLRISHILAAKFLVAYLPTLGLGLVFLTVIAVAQKLSLLEFVYSLIVISMCLAGMAGILLSFGVAGANFNWDDPRKMNAGALGCLGQILTMTYLPVSFGAFMIPLGLAQFLNSSLLYGYGLGLVVGVGLTVMCAIVPLWLVRKKVQTLGEE